MWEGGWLAADFEADVADGLLVGKKGVFFCKNLSFVIARRWENELSFWKKH